MISLELLSSLSMQTDSKIVLLVIDGLGGFPHPDTGLTELESAATPNLDALAARSIIGLSDPVGPGITPGSGAGHLALFGYDPITFDIGRGALSAFGLDFDLQPNDMAARANFATIDDSGVVTDRRAGRISTEYNQQLVAELNKIELPDVQVIAKTESGHRALVVFRGEGLGDQLTDTDPLLVGKEVRQATALSPDSEHSAHVVNLFSAKARKVLASMHPANGILMRGFAKHPQVPTLQEVYKLNPAAIAAYPMYRGVARLVGMKALAVSGEMGDEVNVLEQNWQHHDYFFVHIKYADSAGEDGDFARKVKVIEQTDELLPRILALNPDVLVVTGDHSTPAVLKNHSWHPVPLLLYSPNVIPDRITSFGERSARTGGLGHFPAREAMSLMMGYALKLNRYGA